MKAIISLQFTVYGLRFYNRVASIVNRKSKILTSIFILFALLFAFSAQGIAQGADNAPVGDGNGRNEKLESMKIAFFTQRLNLTPEEAKSFWPVYNAFQDELDKLRNAHREALMDAKDNIDKMSDKDIEKLVDNELIFRQNELDVFKKYSSRFKQVLPIRKVAKLYRAEENWKRKVLDLWREKREDRMGR